MLSMITCCEATFRWRTRLQSSVAFVLVNQCSVQVYGRESVTCELRLVNRHVIDCKVACKKLNCVAEDQNISGIVSAENSGCRAH